MGVIRGDTRSLDYSSNGCGVVLLGACYGLIEALKPCLLDSKQLWKGG